MLNEKKEINKPLPCEQKWEDMLPADKGKICLGCGKLVSDFRKYSWADIAKVHSNSPIPVCGIYSEEQLNFWGKEISSHQSTGSKLMTLTAALLALIQLYPTTLQSQTKVTQQQTQSNKKPSQNKPLIAKASKKLISGTVVVHQSDSTKRPAYGVSIFVMQDSLLLKTTSDSMGRFEIDITYKFNKLPNRITLVVSHHDFPIKTISLNKFSNNILDITLYQKTIEARKVSLMGHASYYYALPPVKKDTVKKERKKWWQWK